MFLEKSLKGPWGLSHGVWDLPKAWHWHQLWPLAQLRETGGEEVSHKRWEAWEGRHHSQVLCPWGLWLWPRTCPGEFILQGCSQKTAALWEDPGHHPGRAGGRRKPGSGVSRKLRQSPQHPLCSESQAGIPSDEDARLCRTVCFWAVGFLLEALLLHSAEKFGVFCFLQTPSFYQFK